MAEEKLTENFDEIRSLNESLARQNGELKINLSEALKKNTEILAENKTLKEQQNILNEEVSEFRSLHRKLAIYEAMGEPEQIQQVFDKIPELKDELASAQEKIASFEDELGTAEEIRSALEAAAEVADQMDTITNEFGSAEEIRSALESADEFISSKEDEEEEVGSVEDIREALTNARKVISEYRKLGTPREIKECFKRLNESIQATKEGQKKSVASKIAEKYGISENLALSLVKKGISEDEIASMCESKSRKLSVVEKTTRASALESMFDKSKRGMNLMESFSR